MLSPENSGNPPPVYTHGVSPQYVVSPVPSPSSQFRLAHRSNQHEGHGSFPGSPSRDRRLTPDLRTLSPISQPQSRVVSPTDDSWDSVEAEQPHHQPSPSGINDSQREQNDSREPRRSSTASFKSDKAVINHSSVSMIEFPDYDIVELEVKPTAEDEATAMRLWDEMHPEKGSHVMSTLSTYSQGLLLNKSEIIKLLAPLSHKEMVGVKNAYLAIEHNKPKQKALQSDLESSSTSNFEKTLVALVSGPLKNDIEMLFTALRGSVHQLARISLVRSTDTEGLMDVLLCRSNSDIEAMKAAYAEQKKEGLERDLSKYLSGKTKDLFLDIIKGERVEVDLTEPGYTEAIQNDIKTHTCWPTNKEFAKMFMRQSDARMRDFVTEFEKEKHCTLAFYIETNFSSGVRKALKFAMHRALNGPKSDAHWIHDAMRDGGTRDTKLIYRIVRVHWQPERMRSVRSHYKSWHAKSLSERLKRETSPYYGQALLACMGYNSDEKQAKPAE